MICGSPRHSVWLIPRWVAPVPPAIFAVPMTGSRSEGPCPRLEAAFWSLTDVEGAWNFFPPEEKIRFSGNGRIVLSGPCFQSPLLREQALLLVTEGEGQHSQNQWFLSPARSCRHCSSIPDGSGKKQKPELRAGVSRTHPTRETKNKTNSTKK